MMHLSRGAFTSHHCLVYTLNAFLGPDLGSFCEWLAQTSSFGRALGSKAMDYVHDPVYYVLILGAPLCFMYSKLSRILLQAGFLPTLPGVHLKPKECLYLIAAGSLSHFFLDNLFEENGHTKMLVWILSTGWWQGAAPLDFMSVLIVGLLCSVLLASFIYINRSIKTNHSQPLRALASIAIVAALYTLWCAIRVYVMVPRLPAVGEEADLGVLVFLAIFFFAPHALCVASMHSIDTSSEIHMV
ncbi:uncharacterized protein LOC9653117 isoform X2 [Selaginella moellendorffii]|nr:uncharacterized protein LOC9653117 isoform X2 [Selaginella moellendorffii]|eukprot:XP_024539039.1 uncharacterized protein LOC9653117 isoform X2 [Selaginella moellendorffii]